MCAINVQTELCRKVIRLYQDIAVSWLLDRVSWEYLLSVLLYHTHNLLTHKDSALGIAMANSILKVCFCECICVAGVDPSPPADSAGVLPESLHGNRGEPCTLGQTGAGLALTHSLEGGHHTVEGQSLVGGGVVMEEQSLEISGQNSSISSLIASVMALLLYHHSGVIGV